MNLTDESEASEAATHFPGSSVGGRSFGGKQCGLTPHGYWEYSHQNHGKVELPQQPAHGRGDGDRSDYRVDIDVSAEHAPYT